MYAHYERWQQLFSSSLHACKLLALLQLHKPLTSHTPFPLFFITQTYEQSRKARPSVSEKITKDFHVKPFAKAFEPFRALDLSFAAKISRSHLTHFQIILLLCFVFHSLYGLALCVATSHLQGMM